MLGLTASAQIDPAASSCDSKPAVRFATFNVFLNRSTLGQLKVDLERGDAQARAVAEIIQRVRPDVLLLNEFDFDASGETSPILHRNILLKGRVTRSLLFTLISFSHRQIQVRLPRLM